MYTINKLKPLSPSTIDDVPAWFIDMCLAFNENREVHTLGELSVNVYSLQFTANELGSIASI